MPISTSPAWVVTGPTSGIGRRAALELAAHGAVVLVGRDPQKLADVQTEIRSQGGEASPVVADFSDIASVRRADRRYWSGCRRPIRHSVLATAIGEVVAAAVPFEGRAD